MSDKITRFITGSIGGAFDASMSSFPGIAIVWGALKGGVSSIKEKRAEEFIVFVENNISVNNFFDEKFVDGLAIAFENYLKQRIDFKRQVIKNIFLGFASTDDKDNFDLERYYNVLNLINIKQLENLKNCINKKGGLVIAKLDLTTEDWVEDYYDYKYLEFLGILGSYLGRSVETHSDESCFSGSKVCGEERMFATDFGNDFIRFIGAD